LSYPISIAAFRRAKLLSANFCFESDFAIQTRLGNFHFNISFHAAFSSSFGIRSKRPEPDAGWPGAGHFVVAGDLDFAGDIAAAWGVLVVFAGKAGSSHAFSGHNLFCSLYAFTHSSLPQFRQSEGFLSGNGQFMAARSAAFWVLKTLSSSLLR
jgi:hypothetical protein